MSNKSDDRIRKLLDEQINRNINSVNDRIGGIFVYGFILGVIMSYSGFLSYFAGVGTGIVVAKKYKFISHQISEKAMYIFQNTIRQVQEVTD